MHRLRRAAAFVALVLAACIAGGAFGANTAGAADGEAVVRRGHGGIDVVQVEGYFDPANESLVRDSIADANKRGSSLLIFQLSSSGAIDAGVRDIVRAINRSDVPVAVWVGPSGANAKGATTLLLEAAHLAYVSPNSGAGPGHPLQLDDPGASTTAEVADQLAALARTRGRDPDGARKLAARRLGSAAARAVGATDGVEPTIGELIVSLDGKTVTTAAGDVKLSTAKVIGTGQDRRRQPNQEVRFRRLDLGGQVLHRLISPSIAYFLFVAGLALLVFEFYTAGVGLAGLVGALCVIGAFVGFSHLPVQWWAFALLLVATFGFAVDVQVGSLGVWTVIGTIALGAGSLFLYGGSSHLRPAWWVLLVVTLGMVLFMVGGMSAMVRSRFSTPTIGREGMVGELGTAEVPVDPDGVVLIRGARWRARTNRATPVAAGETVRVVAVEGLVLEVEPPEGGARDYRDRARRATETKRSRGRTPGTTERSRPTN
ncbi:MAG TPA: NfeD family protein [Acidimicrobiia bacterium]